MYKFIGVSVILLDGALQSKLKIYKKSIPASYEGGINIFCINKPCPKNTFDKVRKIPKIISIDINQSISTCDSENRFNWN